MSVDGVILAAGFSERTGQFKPMLDLGGKPILERCIDSMTPVCNRIFIVGGYNFDKIKELACHLPNVTIVKNDVFELGMFSSVKTGIREIKAERFFIIPGDQPLVHIATYQKMLAVDTDIVIPRYKGKKGHPVLFRRHLIEEIIAMPDTAILRDFIHSKKVTIVDVDDPGIGMDVDSLEDYEIVKTYFKEEMR